jgi:tellurite resistance protein
VFSAKVLSKIMNTCHLIALATSQIVKQERSQAVAFNANA